MLTENLFSDETDHEFDCCTLLELEKVIFPSWCAGKQKNSRVI